MQRVEVKIAFAVPFEMYQRVHGSLAMAADPFETKLLKFAPNLLDSVSPRNCNDTDSDPKLVTTVTADCESACQRKREILVVMRALVAVVSWQLGRASRVDGVTVVLAGVSVIALLGFA